MPSDSLAILDIIKALASVESPIGFGVGTFLIVCILTYRANKLNSQQRTILAVIIVLCAYQNAQSAFQAYAFKGSNAPTEKSRQDTDAPTASVHVTPPPPRADKPASRIKAVYAPNGIRWPHVPESENAIIVLDAPAEPARSQYAEK